MNSLTIQKKIFIISFLFIPVLLLGIFVIYPSVSLLWMSFTSWDGVTKTKEFIGLNNYIKMFADSPNVWLSLKNNGVYFVVHLIFIPLELIVAVMLDSKLKASNFFKTVVFMPYIVNGVAIAYAFSYFYSPYNGALNEILKAIGLGAAQQSWLGNEHIVNFSLSVISLWKYCGFHVILFLAGLQTIPAELIEASVVDGANAFTRFINITIPSIKTVIEIILFLNIRGTLQVFDIPFVTTGGGPGYASSTFTVFTLATAFNFNNFGMASTMGVTLMFLIVVLSWMQNKIFKYSIGG